MRLNPRPFIILAFLAMVGFMMHLKGIETFYCAMPFAVWLGVMALMVFSD